MKDGRAGYSIYRTAQWQALRLEAKRRDDFKCTECGARGRLEVHHKIPVRQAPELAYELSNTQCLCTPCHTKKTNAERGIILTPERKAWQSLLQKGI